MRPQTKTTFQISPNPTLARQAAAKMKDHRQRKQHEMKPAVIGASEHFLQHGLLIAAKDTDRTSAAHSRYLPWTAEAQEGIAGDGPRI